MMLINGICGYNALFQVDKELSGMALYRRQSGKVTKTVARYSQVKNLLSEDLVKELVDSKISEYKLVVTIL